VERSNKREKNDYLLEAGKHRSTKMWYCRLYAIMMLQHLDAWEMPSVEDFQMSLKNSLKVFDIFILRHNSGYVYFICIKIFLFFQNYQYSVFN
jgi:hypothetical protein